MVRWLEAKLPTQCLSSAGKCSPDQLNSCDQACDPFPVVKCVCGLSSKGMMTASPECKVVVAVRKSAPGLSGGSIAGITIGVIILVILIVGPIIACWVFPSLRKYAPCAKIRDSDGYFQVDRDRKRGGSKNSKSNYRKFENAESPPDDEI